jgi:hypothetical protein
MVKPEKYDLRGSRLPKAINHSNLTIAASRLERGKNGSWTVVLDIAAAFELTDGRRVPFQRQVRLKGTQEGFRPNPDPFGWKRRNRSSRATRGKGTAKATKAARDAPQVK